MLHLARNASKTTVLAARNEKAVGYLTAMVSVTKTKVTFHKFVLCDHAHAKLHITATFFCYRLIDRHAMDCAFSSFVARDGRSDAKEGDEGTREESEPHLEAGELVERRTDRPTLRSLRQCRATTH
ncbi:hypothetical protein L596_029435 [Steinernema carpocapsae]|uniref:Uncharacterized protein n=1 Tax=Steinernema carpocapsae TaxID=34508 RepID=A0A4U5LUM4_STECR|nr:hypothetical protein L596_029435 [Steinernema carpocapsae]